MTKAAVASGRCDPLPIEPLARPVTAAVRVPGSKSLTNRALAAASLARGASVLRGALHADDTEAMAGCLSALGIRLAPHWPAERIEVMGCAGEPPAERASLDARLSGTTARFVLPLAALGRGRYRIDGAPGLRARPMGPSLEALSALGVGVAPLDRPGRLPVEVSGGPLRGGRARLSGTASSQFLSGLLLAGPAARDGLALEVTGRLVSRPYVDMTIAVMRAFGAEVERPDDRTWVVRPGGYRGAVYDVEPDATAASYLFALAALTGSSIAVEGLGTASVQGDLRFVDLLEAMGARVERAAGRTTVTGTGALRGIEVDMADISDTAQTLAAVAVFADRPTTVRGIGFARAKETDRIAAVIAELRRCGVDAREDPDGFTVHPGQPRPTVVRTYGDHRMAMSFSLLGLRAPGISIADPAVVAKTFPGYWDLLDSLRAGQ